MTVPKSNASLMSRLVVFLLPLVLAAYWPLFGTGQSVHALVIAVRLTLLAGVAILSSLWIGGKLTSVEVRWMGVLGAYLGIVLVSVFADADASRGLHNWLRVLGVYCVALALARPLRHKATAQTFGVALGAAGILSMAFILVIYLHYAGLSLPSYEHIREFKTQVQHASGVALNPLASATVLFCALGLCLVNSGWMQRGLALVTAILASVFTGSRAPFALSIAALAALYITELLCNRTLVFKAIACSVIFAVIAASLLGFVILEPTKLSAATEGRYDVWTVGIEKFLERPITGYGAESWRDDLVDRLPGYYIGTSGLTRLHAGGYHSEFVTLLSEGGLLCFIPGMFIFGLLFTSCCRIAFHPATSRFKGQALIFTFFLLFFRASVEVPGLFGYGEDVTDYLAAMFLAIVVSRESLLAGRPTGAERRNPNALTPSTPAFPVAMAEA